MLQAVIMAAGQSTRTYPLTLTKPKPLLFIANKPILAHQLDQFIGLIQEAIIVVGYKSKMIQDYFGYSYRGIALGYVEQQEQLGTGHAAMQARPYVPDRFILMNGDDLYAREDFEACLDYPYSLLAKEVADPEKYGVLTVENGLVRDLIEKPERPVSNLANVGMYVLDSKIFGILDTIPKTSRGEYEVTDAMKRLAQITEVHCHVTDYWIPVGYPWHILNANDFLLAHRFEEIARDKIASGPPSKKGRIRGIIEEGVKIEGNIFLEENSIIRQGSYIQGNICIGRNCVIGPNCHITGNTAIGDNTHIGHGVVVENSIIDRQCRIEPFCNISHSVLGEDVLIESGTVTMSAPMKTKTVTSVIKGQTVASDRERFGTTLGSHVNIQPHVVIYPGVKITANKVIPPGKVVKKDMM